MKLKKIAVFGGAFDPLTVGHEAIINSLLEQYETVHLYITNNDEKHYSASWEDRRGMVSAAFGNAVGRTLEVFPQNTRTYELLQTVYKPEDIDLILGYDEIVALTNKTWKNSDELLGTYTIRVVPRDFNMVREGEFAKFGNITGLALCVPDVASTEVRNKMYMNPTYNGSDVSPSVEKYIRIKGLYHQVQPLRHWFDEWAELAKYEPGDYPKPSVTVTMVVINALRDDRLGRQDQVLLVRRKKFPFANFWCLPGGFTNPHESVEESAARELKEETGISIDDRAFHQLKVYLPDDPRADLRYRAELEQKVLDAKRQKLYDDIANAIPGLIDPVVKKMKQDEIVAEQTKIDTIRNHWVYDVALYVKGSLFPHVHGADDALEAAWVPLEDARKTKLAFHHNKILEDYIAAVGG